MNHISGRGSLVAVVVSLVVGVPVARAGDFLEGEKAPVLYSVDGDAAGDQFGWEVASIGDVDGDGIPDWVTGAPWHAAGGAQAGQVAIHSGATGKRIRSVDGKRGMLLGWSVSAAGDWNGDGVPDILAGGLETGVGAGHVLVISGKNGAVLLDRAGATNGDRLGEEVRDVGDVNGDGLADFVVSSPGHDGAAVDTGLVELIAGGDGRVLHAWAGTAAGERLGCSLGAGRVGKRFFVIAGSALAGARPTGSAVVWDAVDGREVVRFAGDAAAAGVASHFVSVLGDTDGDGVADFWVSDWQSGALGPTTGRGWVLSGTDGKPRLQLTGAGPGAGFGIGDARAGDVDGDGTDDLVIGAWLDGRGAVKGGRVDVLSGRNGAPLGSWTCTRAGDNFGFDATGLGDVNGDGHPDLLTSSCGGNAAPSPAGRVWVLSGAALLRDGKLVKRPTTARAAALLLNGDNDGAAREARGVVSLEAKDGTAWATLGMAEHTAGRYEEALVAHERSATFPGQEPGGHYNAACARALLGRTDEAFLSLARAFDAGFGAFGLLATDTDLASLRRDPRFPAVMGALRSRGPKAAALPGAATALPGGPREFDFWHGNWDVDTLVPGPGGTLTSNGSMTLLVEPVADGRATVEYAEGGAGATLSLGYSLRVFDTDRGLWHLVLNWPPRGNSRFSDLHGRFQADRGEFFAGGQGGWSRYTFSDIAADRFRWDSAVSRDGGATWQVTQVFQGKRRAADAPALRNGPSRGNDFGTADAFRAGDRLLGTFEGMRRFADGRQVNVTVASRSLLEGVMAEDRTTLSVDGGGTTSEYAVRGHEPLTGRWVEFRVDDGGPALRRLDGVLGGAGDEVMMGLEGAEFVRLRRSVSEDGTLTRVLEKSTDGGRTWTAAWTETFKRRG